MYRLSHYEPSIHNSKSISAPYQSYLFLSLISSSNGISSQHICPCQALSISLIEYKTFRLYSQSVLANLAWSKVAVSSTSSCMFAAPPCALYLRPYRWKGQSSKDCWYIQVFVTEKHRVSRHGSSRNESYLLKKEKLQLSTKREGKIGRERKRECVSSHLLQKLHLRK